MAKGKPWTVEDERQLRQLLTEKKFVRSIAKVLGKTLTSIQMKASRLGLVVVDGGEKNTPSTSTFDKLILTIESCSEGLLIAHPCKGQTAREITKLPII